MIDVVAGDCAPEEIPAALAAAGEMFGDDFFERFGFEDPEARWRAWLRQDPGSLILLHCSKEQRREVFTEPPGDDDDIIGMLLSVVPIGDYARALYEGEMRPGSVGRILSVEQPYELVRVPHTFRHMHLCAAGLRTGRLLPERRLTLLHSLMEVCRRRIMVWWNTPMPVRFVTAYPADDLGRRLLERAGFSEVDDAGRKSGMEIPLYRLNLDPDWLSRLAAPLRQARRSGTRTVVRTRRLG